MANVTSMPDDVTYEVGADQSLLDAGLEAGITFAHACGGRALCSTCRVAVTEGVDACPPRTEAEARMAARLGLADDVRLACQLRPAGDLKVRRLVLDETDLRLASQLDRAVAARAGETKEVTVCFADIAGFTAISKSLPSYDVMYLLNRYFAQVGDIIERHDGFIDKFVGDGVMALFGIDDQPDAPLSAVAAALDILAAVDRTKPWFRRMYGADFDIRIGLHHGEAVLGSLGTIGHERLTAIGDVVNVASRIEEANKEAGTRLLISEALHEKVRDRVETSDFLRIRLKGTEERITLYEVSGLTKEARAALARRKRETMRYAGRSWTRVMHEDALAPGAWKIVRLPKLDLVVLRRDEGFYAFNNACPHVKIPFFDIGPAPEGAPPPSVFTEDRGVICRWHASVFDLQTGEIRAWAPALDENGRSAGFEYLGDISKNRCKLDVYPTRVADGHLWIALD